MIYGIGTDIIEVERVRQAIERHRGRFLERLFTEAERRYCEVHADSVVHYAGRFAAKEAIAKALGTGFGKDLGWHDVEIINEKSGKPLAIIKGKREESLAADIVVHLSISHCRSYATATAVITHK
ncbi:holo-ACP synthase [Simkania negevensis]|uniref:Holo-[acyl-carrier-protein] synthase n=1 Tax=Simkania negevensis TaxID=83561 RepID=A0ABS3AUK3_9BACT|nr:holo-ACP synthase [Simkania negevensis]